MARLMTIYEVENDKYYTKKEATEALKISYRTFEKYFDDVDKITTIGGKTSIYKGEDLNRRVAKLVKEKIFSY